MKALYNFQGIVKEGHKRGKQLGFPTMNMSLKEQLPEGIYVSHTIIDTVQYNALTFIGAAKTYNQKEAKIGKKLEGIEYMDDAIQLGKKMHPTLTIKKGDIYKLPYKADSFDVVICSEVMEHLENPEEALAELKRVSKKYVALSVPNEPLFTIQRILRGKNVLKLGDHPEHIQHWTSSQFKKFVGKHFKIVSDNTPLPWTLVIAKK